MKPFSLARSLACSPPLLLLLVALDFTGRFAQVEVGRKNRAAKDQLIKVSEKEIEIERKTATSLAQNGGHSFVNSSSSSLTC